jgi:quinol monooxygenase YgiN
MFIAVRHYRFNASDSQQIDTLVNGHFVPSLKQAPGFINYYWANVGNGEGVSVSVFQDKAGADASIALAAAFVKQHMPTLLTQPPVILEGPVQAAG